MDAITCRVLVASNGVMCVNADGTHFTIAASIGREEMPTVGLGLGLAVMVVFAPFRDPKNERADCEEEKIRIKEKLTSRRSCYQRPGLQVIEQMWSSLGDDSFVGFSLATYATKE
jgi:hypothetical protein